MNTVQVTITRQVCLFDEETYNKHKMHGLSVCTKPDGYKTLVFATGPNKTRYYSRIVMDAKPGEEVDHKDGNTLNNHIDNLRIVTSSQNKWNTKKKINKSGLPKGVTKHGTSFRASITKNYLEHKLGTFPTVEQAEAAYKKKADELFGEHAFHNSRK